MFFCQKCRNFSDVDKCQFCGAKKLREAQENDPIYLTAKNGFAYAGMLQEVLRRNNIPVICQEKNGGILKYLGGFGVEEYNFFVPLGSYKRAKKLVTRIFNSSDLHIVKNPKFFKQGKRTKSSSLLNK